MKHDNNNKYKYDHILNINVEFHLPSKCQTIVIVPDILYCGKYKLW